jgi:hypothetical protein
MTSIQPDRLAKEVNQLGDLVHDPPRLRQHVVDVLEFYSDRTRRPRRSSRIKAIERKYGVAKPVMAALTRALDRIALENPYLAEGISDELWQAPYRETRLLAIRLLSKVSFHPVWIRAETWSQETKDYELLAKLAEVLVDHWSKAGFIDFNEKLADWMKSSIKGRHLISLLVLHFASIDQDFEKHPYVFHLIRVHEISNDPLQRRALLDLLRVLIQRSPAESARYLIDVSELNKQKGRRLVKSLLPEFPKEEQSRLKQVLKR